MMKPVVNLALLAAMLCMPLGCADTDELDVDGNDAAHVHQSLAEEGLSFEEVAAIPEAEILVSLDAGASLPSELSATIARESKAGSTGPYVAVATREKTYYAKVPGKDLKTSFRDKYGPGMLAPAGELKPRGWSNGSDSRTRQTTALHYHGLVNGNCSGTLIGPRIVRTAAHCIVANNSSGGEEPPDEISWSYRRNGTAAQITVDSESVRYGGAYIPNGCARSSGTDYWWGYTNNLDACLWADWAYLILPSNWNDGTWYTWAGYQGLTAGSLGTRLSLTGYPACGNSHSPSGCVSSTQYRDRTTKCTVYSWLSGQARWRTDCDTSSGQSGSGVMLTSSSDNILVGHFQYEDCFKCSTSDKAPNRVLGHDGWLFDYQNSLRSTFP